MEYKKMARAKKATPKPKNAKAKPTAKENTRKGRSAEEVNVSLTLKKNVTNNPPTSGDYSTTFLSHMKKFAESKSKKLLLETNCKVNDKALKPSFVMVDGRRKMIFVRGWDELSRKTQDALVKERNKLIVENKDKFANAEAPAKAPAKKSTTKASTAKKSAKKATPTAKKPTPRKPRPKKVAAQ